MAEKHSYEMVGVNQDYLIYTANKLRDYLSIVEDRFNKIDDIMSNNNQYYKSASAEVFCSRYDDFKQNYKIIKTNLMSYIDDLDRTVNHYVQIDSLARDVIGRHNDDNL